MECSGPFPPRGRFHGRNFRGCMMQRPCARPYDCFNEFISPFEDRFAFEGWHNPRGGFGHHRRCNPRFRRECIHLNGEEKKKGKINQGSPDDKTPAKETPENEMSPHPCGNEEISFFDRFSSFFNTVDEEDFFEVIVNLRGCNPENIKVGITNGVLTVEGRTETSERGFMSIRHEQSIPKEVSASSLKASLYPEGILTVKQEERTVNIPLQIDVEEKEPTEEDLEGHENEDMQQ